MTTTTRIKKHVLSIIKQAREIAEESNKAMSISQIIDKFNPGFPFQIKKVNGEYVGSVFTVECVLDAGSRCICGKHGAAEPAAVLPGYPAPAEHCCKSCNKSYYKMSAERWVLI